MSHYDYFSPHTGLSGLDASSLMQTGAQVVGGIIGTDKTKDQAWNFFRFNDMNIAEAERARRFESWTSISDAFKTAMYVQAQIEFPYKAGAAVYEGKEGVDPATLSTSEKGKVQKALKSKFESAWKSIQQKVLPPTPPPAPSTGSGFISRTGVSFDPRAALLTGRLTGGSRPFPGGTASGAASGSSEDSGEAKPFPIVPVAIGAAVVAILLLRRK